VASLPGHTTAEGVPLSTAVLAGAWCLDLVGVFLVAELACASWDRAAAEAEAALPGKRRRAPAFPTFEGLVDEAAGPRAAAAFTAGLHGLTHALLVCCMAGLGRWGEANAGVPYAAAIGAVTAAAAAVATGRVPFPWTDAANRALIAACLGGLAATAAPLALAHGSASASAFAVPAAPVAASAFAVPAAPVAAAAPALPVAVLTFGFHIVTPYVVGLLRGDVGRVAAALAVGGAIPLVASAAWNAAALVTLHAGAGLGVGAPAADLAALRAPDALFAALGAGSAAGAAPQLFLLGALGSTLLAYALAFPPQLRRHLEHDADDGHDAEGVVDRPPRPATVAQAALALLPPAVLALALPSAFDLALRVGGNLVNGTLFGLAPPVLAHLGRAKHPAARRLVPGGDATLAAVFACSLAVMLAGA